MNATLNICGMRIQKNIYSIVILITNTLVLNSNERFNLTLTIDGFTSAEFHNDLRPKTR